MEATEFPVGRLLNGDSYKTQTRMKNISSAMNWIHKQLESLHESDKQLLSLFNKLESDMGDLKTLCIDGGRIRTASVSSIGGLAADNSASSLRYDTSYHSILEESKEDHDPLERSSSTDSLENFADLLGEDEDDVEDMPHTTDPSSSLKREGSTFSSEFSFNPSIHSNHDHISEEEVRGLDDALSMTSQSSGSSSRLNVANSSPHLSHLSGIGKNLSHHSSNDSGALVDPDSSSGHDNTQSSTGSTFDTSLTSTLTETDKRLSGLAGEIFALLNMK